MTLPKPENWGRTVQGLHQGARLLGAVQQLTQDPQPAYLEIALKVAAEGLVTGPLPSGGRVLLDIAAASLVYQIDGQRGASFQLNGRSQARVFEDLFGFLAERELSGVLPPGADLFERVAAGIGGRKVAGRTASGRNRYKAPPRETLYDPAPVEIDPTAARDYLRALQEIFTGLARFKARLMGMQTPLVVWPHGFDLSTLWFAGKEIDESQFHMNFGFSPGSAGIDYPYLYAYAYPYPGDESPAILPEGAQWHTQGWKGIVLPYEAIAGQPDPAAFIETSCAVIYAGFLPGAPGAGPG